MIVYLAGPIFGATDAEANDWRDIATQRLEEAGHATLNPMRHDYRGHENQYPVEIVNGDKDDIDGSDAVLAYCPKPSAGTSMEVLYCFDRHIPCVVVVPEALQLLGTRLSPWLVYHAREVHATLEAGLDAVARIVG